MTFNFHVIRLFNRFLFENRLDGVPAGNLGIPSMVQKNEGLFVFLQRQNTFAHSCNNLLACNKIGIVMPDSLRAVNSILVLLIDHFLASSRQLMRD